MSDQKDLLMGHKKIPFSVMIKRTFHYVKPEIWHFALALFLIAINVALDVLLPLIVSEVVNNLKSENISLTIIIIAVVGYFILSLINQLFLFIESMILQKSGQRIIYNLRMEVFEHIENMSINQFNDMPVGSLVTRVCNYTSSMSDLFTNVLVNVIRNVLTIIAVYTTMCIISPKLSLILTAVVVVVFIISYVFSRIVSKIFRKEREYISDLNTYLNENISGMKLIQIFNQEIRKSEEFNEKNERLRKARYERFHGFFVLQAMAARFLHGRCYPCPMM